MESLITAIAWDVAAVAGDRVRVQGNSPGTATITVTATDPDSLSGTLSFTALVPNQAPIAFGVMPDVSMVVGGSLRFRLARYFTEPDGQDLTYSIAFSDTGVATASVSGDTVNATAGDAGTTAATATATDPGGLSATQDFTLSVVVPELLLRDDFDSEESLENWVVGDSSAIAVDDGMLWVHNTVDDFLGYAASNPLSAVEWNVTASMGSATEDAWAALGVLVDDRTLSLYLLQIGDDGGRSGLGSTNWRFYVFAAQTQAWIALASGQSDAIGDVGELTEVSLGARGGLLTVTAGSTELLRRDFPDGYSDNATSIILASWPDFSRTGNRTFFDWVEATGIPLDDTTSTNPAPRSIAPLGPLPLIRSGSGLRVHGGRGAPPARRAPLLPIRRE